MVLRTFMRSVVLGLALFALGASQAAAHAELESSTPASGAVLAHAPRLVVLRFGEPVETRFGSIAVYSPGGDRVDDGNAGHIAGVADSFGTAVGPDLPDGRYLAIFRVVAADGHPGSGSVTFTIGHATAAGAEPPLRPPGPAESGPITKGAFAAVRALDDLSIGLAIGLLVFLLSCWRPALADVAGAGPDWHRASSAFATASWRALRRTVLLGAVVSCLGILFEGAIAGGSTLWGAVSPAVIADTLSTRFGTVGSAKLVLWTALGVALLRVSPQRSLVLQPAALGADGQALERRGLPPTLALAVPAAALALAPALAGHASTHGDSRLLVPAAVVHVVAMSVWVGGLVALALLTPRATAALDEPADRSRLLAGVLSRFSPLALAAVIALQVTGTIQSVAYLRSFGDLLHDAFGRAVLAKIVLVLALMALGAINRRRAMPRLARLDGDEPEAATALLYRVVRAEIALLLVVLGITGVLTGLAPTSSNRPETHWKQIRHGADTTPP